MGAVHAAQNAASHSRLISFVLKKNNKLFRRDYSARDLLTNVTKSLNVFFFYCSSSIPCCLASWTKIGTRSRADSGCPRLPATPLHDSQMTALVYYKVYKKALLDRRNIIRVSLKYRDLSSCYLCLDLLSQLLRRCVIWWGSHRVNASAHTHTFSLSQTVSMSPLSELLIWDTKVSVESLKCQYRSEPP